LLVCYAVYRYQYPAAFLVAARETDVVFGTINAVLLLTSSMTVALAVRMSRAGQAHLSGYALLATVALGLAFLVVKAFEYSGDIGDGLFPGPGFRLGPPQTQIFWSLYWIMTGVHALHLIVGIGVLVTVFALLRRAAFDSRRNTIVEGSCLYWHFVDIVWIFLYPLLYLPGRS
ncbi:MAG: cytochrome c oxidase subunit 3, partial [Methylobacteriaceae bacterium]|nr:cytochrome c oxidase subunit 3 [Methylobacteriaceae bacterium]